MSRTFSGGIFMLASAAIKNALVGFPMTFASTPQAYCTHSHQSHRWMQDTHCKPTNSLLVTTFVIYSRHYTEKVQKMHDAVVFLYCSYKASGWDIYIYIIYAQINTMVEVLHHSVMQQFICILCIFYTEYSMYIVLCIDLPKYYFTQNTSTGEYTQRFPRNFRAHQQRTNARADILT